MTIPGFEDLMLPLLQIAGDGQEHETVEAVERLAEEFNLTPEDRKALLPSGTQRRFNNRVGWARTYLVKARLLESTGRGRFRITGRGIGVLKNKPSQINTAFLRQFPEFVEFIQTSRSSDRRKVRGSGASNEVSETETPEELLESSYEDLRQTLAQELLDRLKQCSPAFFEKLVVDLLIAMGYGGSRRDAGQAIGRSGDEGIDGIINEDKLGLDTIYIQAKRWDSAVGRPIVQGFAGSLEGQRARKGILITTSTFTADAKEYVKRIEKRIILIDGDQLAKLMIDHDVGVTVAATYRVKKLNQDYFDEEA